MGLKILSFKNKVIEFKNAFCKVDKLSYDNNTKIIAFNLAVYSNENCQNEIKKFSNLWAKSENGVDYTKTCYVKLNEILATKKAIITQVNLDIEAAVEDNEKLRLVAQKAQMENQELLQFDSAVSDEVVTE